MQLHGRLLPLSDWSLVGHSCWIVWLNLGGSRRHMNVDVGRKHDCCHGTRRGFIDGSVYPCHGGDSELI